MNMFSFLLDIIFPRNCVVCKKPNEDLCLSCLASFEYSPLRKSIIHSCFEYTDKKVRATIQALKYKKRKHIGAILGYALFSKSIEFLPQNKIFVVIPIPLSRKRLHERGFNQSEVIAKAFCMRDKNKFILSTNILVKNQETKHQAQIKNRRERKNNLIDSFDVKRKEFISGRDIILIDDVTTTGATFAEACRALRTSGARKVICIAVAH